MKQNTPVTPEHSSMQLGILFGVIMVLEFVVLYVIDVDPISNPVVGTIINFCNYLILPLLLISIACTSFKKANFGFISYGECIKEGLKLCVIAGLIYGLFNIVFILIFPEFVDEILRKTKAVMIKDNPELTTEQLDMGLVWVKKLMNPVFSLPITLAMYSFLGLIYSLIIGAIIKKDKPLSF
jgi:hypothetical protein